MKSEDNTSRLYRIWLITKESPGIKLSGIAEKMGLSTKSISDAISKMVNRGHLKANGCKGSWEYSAVLSNPPEMKGRGTYSKDDCIPGEVEFLKPTPGNPVFNDCRQSSGNYWLTRLVREARA